MNDPQRPFWLDGAWHYYYLYNADYPDGNGTEWYHATSTDLVHWREEGVAIAKYENGLGDIETGSAVVDTENTAGFGAGAVIAIMTQQDDGRAAPVAVRLDRRRLPLRAVRRQPGDGQPGRRTHWRDPKIVWDDARGEWLMVLAEGHKLGFYTSPDLKDWTYRSGFERDDLGILECPDLFQMSLDGDPAKTHLGARRRRERRRARHDHGHRLLDRRVGRRGVHRRRTPEPAWLDRGADFYATVTWDDPRLPESERLALALRDRLAQQLGLRRRPAHRGLARRRRLDRARARARARSTAARRSSPRRSRRSARPGRRGPDARGRRAGDGCREHAAPAARRPMPTACGSRSRPTREDPAVRGALPHQGAARVRSRPSASTSRAGVAFVARDADAAAAAMPDAYRAVRTAPAPLRDGVVTLDVDRGRLVGRGVRERRRIGALERGVRCTGRERPRGRIGGRRHRRAIAAARAARGRPRDRLPRLTPPVGPRPDWTSWRSRSIRRRRSSDRPLGARGADRAALDELAREQHRRRGIRLDAPSMRSSSVVMPQSAHLAMRQGDRREPGLEGVGHDLEVVDADDRAVAGTCSPSADAAWYHAHRHLVVEAEHRGRANLAPGTSSSRRPALRPPAASDGAAFDVGAVGVEPGLPQRGCGSPPRGRGSPGPHRSSWPSRSGGVRRRRGARPRSRRCPARRERPPARAIRRSERRRRATVGVSPSAGGRATSWCDMRASRIPSTRWSSRARSCSLLELGITLGVDHHQHDPALARRLLRTLHDTACERRGGDAIAHEPHHAGALQAQSAREAIGRVAELGCRADHSLAGLGPHGARAAQRVRHGRLRDTGKCGHRTDARATTHRVIRSPLVHGHRAYAARRPAHSGGGRLRALTLESPYGGRREQPEQAQPGCRRLHEQLAQPQPAPRPAQLPRRLDRRVGVHRGARNRRVPRRRRGRRRTRRACCAWCRRRSSPRCCRRSPTAGAVNGCSSSSPSCAGPRPPPPRWSSRSPAHPRSSTRSPCCRRSPPPSTARRTPRCCRRCAAPATSSRAPTWCAGCSTPRPRSSVRWSRRCCSSSPGSTSCSGSLRARRSSAAALLVRLRYDAPPRPPAPSRPNLAREAVEGVRAVVQNRDLTLILGLAAAQALTRGALTVFSVVVAIELLGTGEPGVGALMTAVGVGAVLGSLAASLLVGSGRLGAWFAVGVGLWGLPLTLVAVVPQQAAALGLLAFIGVGNALVDLAGFTLIARMAPDEVLARVFGVLESLVAVFIGIGAVVASSMVEWFGRPDRADRDRTASARCSRWPRGGGCGALDRSVDVLDTEIRLLQQVPMFGTLPLPAVEQLARGLEPVTVAADRAVFTQGDIGDRYYVIESGEVDVVGDGQVVATLGPGEGFGEIALLRRTRRTATVVARSDAPAAGAGLRPVPPRRPRLHAERSAGGDRRRRHAATATSPKEPFDGVRTADRRCDAVRAAVVHHWLWWEPRAMESGRAVLLIADIGGYTDYMSTHRMSLSHAEVNTARHARQDDRRRTRLRPHRDRGRRGVPLPPGRRARPRHARSPRSSRPPSPCIGRSTSSARTSPRTSARARAARRRATSS